MKAIEKLFGLSVAVVSLTTLVTTVIGLIGIALPRWAIWVIGIVNLISLPLLIYSTVKSLREKAESARKLGKKTADKTPEKTEAPKSESPAEAKPRPKQIRSSVTFLVQYINAPFRLAASYLGLAGVL